MAVEHMPEPGKAVNGAVAAATAGPGWSGLESHLMHRALKLPLASVAFDDRQVILQGLPGPHDLA